MASQPLTHGITATHPGQHTLRVAHLDLLHLHRLQARRLVVTSDCTTLGHQGKPMAVWAQAPSIAVALGGVAWSWPSTQAPSTPITSTHPCIQTNTQAPAHPAAACPLPPALGPSKKLHQALIREPFTCLWPACQGTKGPPPPSRPERHASAATTATQEPPPPLPQQLVPFSPTANQQLCCRPA